jgi:hypothetical protein
MRNHEEGVPLHRPLQVDGAIYLGWSEGIEPEFRGLQIDLYAIWHGRNMVTLIARFGDGAPDHVARNFKRFLFLRWRDDTTFRLVLNSYSYLGVAYDRALAKQAAATVR